MCVSRLDAARTRGGTPDESRRGAAARLTGNPLQLNILYRSVRLVMSACADRGLTSARRDALAAIRDLLSAIGYPSSRVLARRIPRLHDG
jgi:hypothetical protein